MAIKTAKSFARHSQRNSAHRGRFIGYISDLVTWSSKFLHESIEKLCGARCRFQFQDFGKLRETARLADSWVEILLCKIIREMSI